MFNHLKGRLVSAEPASVVVECAGVGFRLRVPLSTFERLPPVGSDCTVLAHLHVREDSLELYGFATELERQMFRRLVSVSGVGPAAAMSLMSHLSVADIIGAIARGEPGPLTRARGIGRKTAERVVLELKGTVAELEAMLASTGAVCAAPAADDTADTVAQALVALGYSASDAERAAKDAAKALAGAGAGEMLREALRRIR